jgi:hypothetical protein
MSSNGLAAGPEEAGQAFGLGPVRWDRISFYFLKSFFIAKTIPVKTKNCLKA